MALTPDSTLHDAYRITYIVDERSDATVYRATNRSGRRLLIAALPQIDAAEVEQTAALARQVATVQAAALLPLVEHFAEGRTYYFVSEDPGGQDLERYARERGGPLPEAHVLEQMDRLLRAVEALHDATPALYVGDLRSSDVWSNTKGELFLAPFPLARPVGAQDLGYRAPELNKPTEEPTTASDMYSFGVLLYQLLTGWLPPSAATREAGMPLNAPRSLNPQVSPLAEQATLRSLELKQANRYQVAREMRRALETVHMMAGRSLGLTEPLTGATQQPSSYAPQSGQQPAAQPSVRPQPVEGTVPVPPPPPTYGGSSSQPAPYPQPPAGAPNYPQQGGYAQPAQGYPAPGWQQNAQAYQQPYAQQPQQRQRGNTCLIVAVVLLGLLALLVVIALAIVLLGPGRALLGGVIGQRVAATQIAPATGSTPAPGAAAGAMPAMPAPSSNPAAISVTSAGGVTETQTLTESLAGPIAFSPDGKLLALGYGPTISLRDGTALDKVQATLTGHAGSINTLAFSPDGAVLASGAIEEPTIRLWDVKAGKPLATIEGHKGWIRSLAFSPDGALLASGSTDTTIKLWDARSHTLVRTLEGHTDFVGRVAFSPDSKLLASTGRDGTVRLWDVASGQQRSDFTFTAPPNQSDPRLPPNKPFWMTGVAFSSDGTLLAAGSTDHAVRVWNVASGKLQQTLQGHTDWVSLNMLAFSADGKTLASGGLDGSVRLWDPVSGASRGVLQGSQLQLLALAFEPDNTHLVTSSDQGGSLTIWNTQTSQIENRVLLGLGLVTSVGYSNDGAVLGSAGVNGTLRLHVFEQDRNLNLIGGAPTSQSFAFVTNNELAVISDQGNVLLLDLTKQGSQPRALSGLDGPAVSLVVSPNSKMIAAGNVSGAVAVWDAASGQRTQTLQVGSENVFALAFSSDAKLIAVSSNSSNPEVTIFDAQSGAKQHTLTGQTGPIISMAFQPNGSLLATASRDGTLFLWNATNGEQVSTIKTPADQGWFSDAAFSPDGSVLVTGAFAGGVDFWEPASGKLVSTLGNEAGGVLALAFRPDGQQLAASMRDGSVRLLAVKG